MADPHVDVVVSPYTEGNDQVKWSINIVDDGHGHNGGHGGFGAYPDIHVDQGQLNTVMTFTIQNGGAWKFDAMHPLWVSDGQSDPSGPPISDQIKGATTTTPGAPYPKIPDTQLRFTDVNSPHLATKLHYTLNFTDGTHTSSTLDPIIQNGGCCPGVNYTNWYIGGGVIAAAVLIFVFWRFFFVRPQADQPIADERQEPPAS